MKDSGIAIDARYAGTQPSGIGRYTLNLLKGIAEVSPDFRIGLLVNDVSIIPDGARSSSSFELIEIGRNPRRPADQLALPRMLKRRGVRLLHSLDAFAPLFSGCARVITVYDLIPLVCRRIMRRTLKGRFAAVWKMWLNAQIRAASVVVAVSRHSAADLERLLNVPPQKIRVINCGVSLEPNHDSATAEALKAKFPLDGRFVLYVGRWDPYKNLSAIISTFARVRSEYGDSLRLFIVGPPDARFPDPHKEAKARGVADSVVFTGYLSDAELSVLYRAAAVFFFPSLYEGFGLPPLEAMSCGTPVVASDRTALPETLDDAAILVNPDDADAMAREILRVLSDKSLAAKLGKMGKERAANFPIRRQAEETLRLYDELLSRRH